MNSRLLVRFSAFSALLFTASPAAESAKAKGRVGVYDSRIVAYAHFWSEPARKKRDALIASAKAAKGTDTARFKTLQQQIVDGQNRSHLEVFSTAPADEAMASLKDRLPAIEQELGVTRLVSQWDETALNAVPAASRVDVTDRLVRELLPQATENQLKTMTGMKKAKPMPLNQANQLAEAGKL